MVFVLNSRKYRLCKQCEKHFILLFAHGIWESSEEEMLEELHDASDSYHRLCQEVEKLLFLIQKLPNSLKAKNVLYFPHCMVIRLSALFSMSV